MAKLATQGIVLLFAICGRLSVAKNDFDETAYKKSYSLGLCVGKSLSATLVTSGLGLMIAAAAKDCPNADDQNGQSRCARDISGLVRDAGTIVEQVQQAVYHCGGEDTKCGATIGGVVKFAGQAAESGADMGVFCNPENQVLFTCTLQLERLGFSVDRVSALISKSIVACGTPDTDGPLMDIGACVGEIIGATTYYAAAGLYITAAVRDCPTSGNDGSKRYVTQQNRCTRDIFAFIRVLAFGSSRLAAAVGHCGGTDQSCSYRVLRGSAAMLAVGQRAAQAAEVCGPNAPAPNDVSCSVQISAVLRVLTLASGNFLDAADACSGHGYTSGMRCGSSISKALTGIASVADQISSAVTRCQEARINGDPSTAWHCGRRMEIVAQSVDVLAGSIGSAVANCGLPSNSSAIGGIINAPRNFFH